ncbi:hypothetical protein [Flavobacterium sp.]|uniref:hypothetical protein n=1 Tax=Flavobacterium sp. TaxID=239 RepID=UPI002607F3EA|nr:hypothetical protein [Flavobacterium sp.]
MNSIKNYVKNNSKTLFRYKNVITNAEFDNRGFFFTDAAELEYNLIKDLPHLYVAWTDCENGYLYVGISNQLGGRWKRQHAYHLGTFAHHLLGTLNSYDQNHQEWINNWMDINTINLGDNLHHIQLFQEVKICFIPFKLYSDINHLSLDKTQIKKINEKTEKKLIESYLLDGLKLLNKKHNGKAKNAKIKKPINSSNKMITSLKLPDYKNCVEFKVTRNQNIATVANGVPNLPVGRCTIELFYNNRADVRFYINGSIRNIRTVNRTVGQYFSAPDTNNRNISKWQIVQNEMNNPNNIIEEITIRVCSPKNITDDKNNVSRIRPSKTNHIDTELVNLELSKNFKVVMVCAGAKHNSYFKAYPNKKFVNKPELSNEHHPDNKMNDKKTSWRDYLIKNQSDINLKKAFELYNPTKTKYPNVYLDLFNKYKTNFYILSAGWGLVNSEYRLPNYDITFSKGKKVPLNTIRNKNITVAPIYHDFNQFIDESKNLLINPEEDILFIGGKDYLKLFYALTQDLPNRKIIYYKGLFPTCLPLNSRNIIFRKYYHSNPKTNTNWHYELANKISIGIIP